MTEPATRRAEAIVREYVDAPFGKPAAERTPVELLDGLAPNLGEDLFTMLVEAASDPTPQPSIAPPVLIENYRAGSTITITHPRHGTITGQMHRVPGEGTWIIPLQIGHVEIEPAMFSKGWSVTAIEHTEPTVSQEQ